ncbi:hypothetical protein [Pontibacter chitinilyticus]
MSVATEQQEPDEVTKKQVPNHKESRSYLSLAPARAGDGTRVID